MVRRTRTFTFRAAPAKHYEILLSDFLEVCFMSDIKELIIYQKYYDLMLYSLPIIGRFPKDQRFMANMLKLAGNGAEWQKLTWGYNI